MIKKLEDAYLGLLFDDTTPGWELIQPGKTLNRRAVYINIDVVISSNP
jgi:hypothetical protein